MKRYISDALVIGAGGAGLTAAMYASKEGIKVTVVNKGILKHSGATIMAPGAVAVVGEGWKTDGDSRQAHFDDFMEGGVNINNPRLVRRIVDEAEQVVKDFERVGVYFERTEDGKSYDLRTDGGHSFKRSLYNEDKIGRELVYTLVNECEANGVEFVDNVMITKLVIENGILEGAIGVCLSDLETIIFDCSSLIIATGGLGYIYENTDNPIDLTGDGLALALDNGIPLVDMEFVQFYPLGYLYPPSLKGLFGAYINHVRLFNSLGERFMEKHNPETIELTTRDILSSAMMEEVLSGRGSPHGGVYADFKHLGPGVMEKEMPGFFKTYKKIGFDTKTQSLEVSPTVHFSMGGIEVDENWETRVPGIFAAGEVAGGAHGANRVSQNAITDILVSGKISGLNAASFSKGKKSSYRVSPSYAEEVKKDILQILNSNNGINVRDYRTRIKNIMWNNVGVLRTEVGLAKAVSELESLMSSDVFVTDKSCFMNSDVLFALENRNMIKVALATAMSASERKETRGSHRRLDFKNTSDDFLKNTKVHEEDGNLIVTWNEIPKEEN